MITLYLQGYPPRISKGMLACVCRGRVQPVYDGLFIYDISFLSMSFVHILWSEKMYSSNSDSESTEKDNATTELQFIADEIANAPVILEKSQTPKIKARKDEAIRNVTRKYEVTFGKALDAKSFLKKINNIKIRSNDI